jgi:hypothetical protein
MTALRPIITSMLAFTLLGIVLGTLLAPTVLSAKLCGYSQDTLTSRPCMQTVQEATTGLLQYQGYGAGGGATVGMIVGIIFAVKSRKKPVPAESKTAAAASTDKPAA